MIIKRFAVFVLVFCFALTTPWASNDIKQLKQALNNAEDKLSTLREELSSQQASLDKLQQHIKTTEQEINQQQELIAELNQKIQQQSEQLQSEQNWLSKQIRAAHQQGQHPGVALLLNQQDPETISRSFTYYRYLNAARVHRIEQIRIKRLQLERNQKALDIAQNRLEQQLEQQKTNQAQLEQANQYRRQMIASLDKEVSSQKKVLAKLLNKLRQDNVAANKPFRQLRHKLPWPIAGKIISRYASPIAGSHLRNNGVVIAARGSKDVKAVASGKVVFADQLKGFGQLVIVQHDHGFMTLYAYNQAIHQQVGSKVAAGEVIATAGFPHHLKDRQLYFEIRHNGQPQNPQSWLKRHA